MSENEWTPGTVYWYEDELKLKEAEIAGLRESLENRIHCCTNLQMTNDKLRAALEEIMAIDPMTQDVLTDDRFEVACGIARKALASGK